MPTATPPLAAQTIAELMRQTQLRAQQQQALQIKNLQEIFAQQAAQRQAQAAAGAAQHQQEIAHEVFMQHMQAMQTHYQQSPVNVATKIELYRLPVGLAPVLVAAHPVVAGPAPVHTVAGLAGAQAVDDLLQQAHAETLSFVTLHSQAICAAAGDAAKNSNTQQFVQKMEQLCAKAKADHDARLDALFNRLQALGTAHPDQRGRILAVTNHSFGFLGNLVIDAVSVARSAGTVITGAAHAVAAAASTVVHKAGDWVAGAAKSVGHFFSSLF